MTITTSGTTITFNDSTTQNTAATGFGFKNRIINGTGVINMRVGDYSAITIGNGTLTYNNIDRFVPYKDITSAVMTWQKSTTAPANFNNSINLNVTTGVSPAAGEQTFLQQCIEGTNVPDLGWGTATAASVTMSFWVRSSVTGTYGIGISNSAAARCYIATYSISAANTWEYKTITIPGDTSGTWLTDTGIGIRIRFDWGSGTNYQATANTWSATFGNTVSGRANLAGTTGATWYITGIQLEKSPTATAFDYRPYGTELQLCERYYEATTGNAVYASQSNAGSLFRNITINFRTMKRTSSVSTLLVGAVGGMAVNTQNQFGFFANAFPGNTTSDASITGYTCNAEL